MQLDRNVYAAFEEAVGAENITEEPSICETYRCAAAQSSAHYGPYSHRTPMPLAVIMPGSTKEVQAVLRLCNRYKIKYKASTTFWSAHGYVGDDYSVQLDMRRMKNFEIDPKNMIITVEPYVIAATAQAEAMKYGLTCNVPGVGCSSSVIASTAGWNGAGPSSIYTGSHYENALCMEWVLPNGDIITTGTAGAQGEWFCGEGPGPSIRAILRGGRGATSDMGICTRLSFKLSPWPGPAYIPSTGCAPAYKAELPSNFRAYTICFPDWDHWSKGMLMLCESEILHCGHRQFSMFGRDIKAAMLRILNDPDAQLADLPELLADPAIQKSTESMKIELCIVLAGMTEADMAWKEHSLDKILELCDGWKDEMCLEPEMEKWLLMYFLRLGHKNLNYVLCGSYEGHFGLNGSNLVQSASVCEEAFAIKREYEQKYDFMAAVGGDSSMGAIGFSGGGGGPMLWEFFAHFDAHDRASVKGLQEYISNVSSVWQKNNKLGTDFCRSCEFSRRPDGYSYSQEELNKVLSQNPQPLPFVYQWKMREMFNPNRLNSSYYQTLEPSAL